MTFLINKIIKPFFKFKIFRKIYSFYIILKWSAMGCPIPAPAEVKRKTISNLQNKYHAQTFVETGTFYGGMVEAQRKNFSKIYSIELDSKLCKNAQLRFKEYSHIEIIQGDSGQVLKKIVPKLKKRSIFWLDGHYSGGETAKGKKETPIFEELKSILSQKIDHILLIDDARCFNGKGDYPTIKNLSEFILKKKPKSKIEIKNDTILVILG